MIVGMSYTNIFFKKLFYVGINVFLIIEQEKLCLLLNLRFEAINFFLKSRTLQAASCQTAEYICYVKEDLQLISNS